MIGEINLLSATGGGAAVLFDWSYVGKHFLNLTILIAILVYLLKKPLSLFLVSRRKKMSDKIAESSQKLEEAKGRFEECARRLEGLPEETRALTESIKTQSEAETKAIIEKAHRDRQEILAKAGEAAELEARRAKESIREEIISSAVGIAERNLRSGRTGGNLSASIRSFAKSLEDGKWLQLQK